MKIKIANIAAEKYGRMRICYNGPGEYLTAECKLAVEETPYRANSRADAERIVTALYIPECWGLIWYPNRVADALWLLKNK